MTTVRLSTGDYVVNFIVKNLIIVPYIISRLLLAGHLHFLLMVQAFSRHSFILFAGLEYYFVVQFVLVIFLCFKPLIVRMFVRQLNILHRLLYGRLVLDF